LLAIGVRIRDMEVAGSTFDKQQDDLNAILPHTQRRTISWYYIIAVKCTFFTFIFT